MKGSKGKCSVRTHVRIVRTVRSVRTHNMHAVRIVRIVRTHARTHSTHTVRTHKFPKKISTFFLWKFLDFFMERAPTGPLWPNPLYRWP